MRDTQSNTSGGGIGFASALTIAFIVLKLVGVITWSWWWVLSPILIATILKLLIIGILLAIALIAKILIKSFDD
jgi:hypothetical protein